MRVVVKPRWDMDGFDVYVFERHPGGTFQYEMRERFGVVGPVIAEEPIPDQHAEPNPTMFLPREIVEELVVAAKNELRISDLASDTIADTRGVRDRALGLVEKLIDELAARP